MGYLVSHAYYVGGRMYRDMAHYGLVATFLLTPYACVGWILQGLRYNESACETAASPSRSV